MEQMYQVEQNYKMFMAYQLHARAANLYIKLYTIVMSKCHLGSKPKRWLSWIIV